MQNRVPAKLIRFCMASYYRCVLSFSRNSGIWKKTRRFFWLGFDSQGFCHPERELWISGGLMGNHQI